MTSGSGAGSAGSTCWCCGQSVAVEALIALRCRPEVTLCDDCVGWLAAQRRGRTLRRAAPVLATTDVRRALDHYRALGFAAEGWEGGGYGFVQRDGVELHLGEHHGLDPTANPVAVYLFVTDAEQLYAEWSSANVSGELQPPTDTDYGLREGRHVDLDGNLIRFGTPVGTADRTGAPNWLLAGDDPRALAAIAAVQAGDIEALTRLLGEHPELATARIGDDAMSRTLLHAATDWPGHFPRVAQIIDVLARAGGDVDARFHGPHQETPLHWAASSDDVDAVDALLDAGADIEASGAVLGGGTPLADACGFGQWRAARRLVERGASTRLKDAAALGLTDRMDAAFASEPMPSPEEITTAFWSACHGGQPDAAHYLLARGADLNWVGWDQLTPLDVAIRADASGLVEWLRAQGAKSSAELAT